MRRPSRVISVHALALVMAAGCAGPSPEAPFDFREALRELSETYGVEIAWEGGPYDQTYDWGSRSARDAADWEIELYAPILIEEMSLYPVSFFQKGEIERIVLVRDLWFEREGVNQNIAGQIFGNREVLLSISYTYKVNHRDKQRRSFHHVLWHHYDVLWGTIRNDPEWLAFNPEDFEYGVHTAGGQQDRTSQSGLLTTDYPGFLNRYSTGNLPDDKADTFAYMMVAYSYVRDRAERDLAIRGKMVLIKRKLGAFDPNMNTDFWARIEAIGRDAKVYMTP